MLLGLGSYWAVPRALAPREAEVVASGGMKFDVPVMALYTLPLPGPNSTGNTSFHSDPGTYFMFSWSSGRVGGMEIRFEYLKSPSPAGDYSPFSSSGDGQLRIRQDPGAFSMSWAHDKGGVAAQTVTVRMNYTVRRMMPNGGLLGNPFLEVDYYLALDHTCFGCEVPPTVIPPGAADLVPTAVKDRLHFSGRWAFHRDLGTIPRPWPTFAYTLPPLSLEGGRYGSIAANLSRVFSWQPGENYRVDVYGNGTAEFNVDWFWDVKFGALVPRSVS